MKRKTKIIAMMLVASLSVGNRVEAQLSHEYTPICLGTIYSSAPAFALNEMLDYPAGTWSVTGPSAAIVNINPSSGVLSGISAGLATVTYTYHDTYSPAVNIFYYGYVKVVAPVTPTITGPSSLCSDPSVTITLTGTPSGGTWSEAYGYVSIDPLSGVVTGKSIGKDQITYSYYDVCGIHTATGYVAAEGPAMKIFTIAGDATNRISGNHSNGIVAGLTGARGMTPDASGNMYIADVNMEMIRKLSHAGVITTYAGSGAIGFGGGGYTLSSAVPALTGQLATPRKCCTDALGNLYITCAGGAPSPWLGSVIRIVTPGGMMYTLAGSPTVSSSLDGSFSSATFQFADGICYDQVRNCLFVIENIYGANIRKLDLTTSMVSSISTGFPSTTIVRDIVNDNVGNLYISTNDVTAGIGDRIYKYDLNTSTLSLFAGGASAPVFPNGDGGSALSAQFSLNSRLACDGSNLYVADAGHLRYRVIDLITPSHIINGFAGNGATASFGTPAYGEGGLAPLASFGGQVAGVGLGSDGIVYLTDPSNRTLRAVTTTGYINLYPGGSYSACGSALAGGFTVTSNASAQGFITYDWYENGVLTSVHTASYTDAFPATGDWYYCVAHVTSFCFGTYDLTSSITTLTVLGCRPAGGSGGTTGLGLNTTSRTDVSVRPNPSNGTISVIGNFEESKMTNDAELQVVDMAGKVILTEKSAVINGAINKTISLGNNVPNGMYLIKIKNDNSSKVIRFTLDR